MTSRSQGPATLLVVMLFGSVVSAAEAQTLDAPRPSLFLYGELIEPPYVFSGVGTDTVRINGLPVHPRRHRQACDASGFSDAFDARYQLARMTLELRARQAACAAAPGKRLDVYLQALRASPLVRRIEVDEPRGIFIFFELDGTMEGRDRGSIERCPPSGLDPLPTVEDVQRAGIEILSEELRSGRWLAIGASYLRTYGEAVPLSAFYDAAATGDSTVTTATAGTVDLPADFIRDMADALRP